jgi:hypothetical protein
VALSAVKTFIAGEVLLASDLNSLNTNILNNGVDLWSPATKAADMNGFELILDADGNTSLTADTDDRIDVKIGGSDLFTLSSATTSRTAVTNLGNIQDGIGVYVATVAGTANAITLTPSPAITAYVAGQRFYFIPASSNSGATTVAVSGLAVKNIFAGNAACVGGEIVASVPVALIYDGTQFQLEQTPFQDNRPLVVGSADRTKKIRFEVDGLTTATTRVITIQDSDDTLVGRATTDTLTNKTLTTPVINSATGIGQALVKRKTADESVTSSTALQNDDHLTFAIAANEEWTAFFSIDGGDNLVTTGLNFAVTVPAGATLDARATCSQSDSTGTLSGNSTASASVLWSPTVFGGLKFHITGALWVLNGANAGSVTIQWAQGSSSLTALTLKKGSSLVAYRIA